MEPPFASPEPPASAPWLPRKRLVRVGIGLAAVAVISGAGIFYVFRTQKARPLLELFPDDSYLVAALDVESLRKGPLADLLAEGDSLAEKQASGILGACAHGAVQAVLEVGIVVPGGASDEGVFAVAARLDSAGPWRSACETELAAKGGSIPKETDGLWTFVGAEGGPRLAMHASGLALWGREPYLRTLASAVFASHSAAVYPGLAGRTGEANVPRHAFAAMTLPAEQRRAFAAVIEAQGGNDSHPELFSIARAALAASIDVPNDTLQVVVRLETDSPQAVPKLRELFERLIKKAGDSLEARAIGVGDALDHARVVTAGDAVVVTAAAPIGRLRMMSQRLRLLGALRKVAPGGMPANSAPTAPGGPGGPGTPPPP